MTQTPTNWTQCITANTSRTTVGIRLAKQSTYQFSPKYNMTIQNIDEFDGLFLLGNFYTVASNWIYYLKEST